LPTAALQFSGALQEGERLLVPGDGAGRHDRGRPVAGMRAHNCFERVARGVHEIGVVTAVHVDIHETGADDLTGCVDGRP
jgi:hypothetical protein